MRKEPFILILLYCFFFLAGSVYGIGEKIFSFGSVSSWNLMEKKQGVIEAVNIRSESVLVLDDNKAAVQRSAGISDSGDGLSDPVSGGLANMADRSSLDLYLPFDEKQPDRFADFQGRYDVSVSGDLGSASAPWSRVGAGAAQFSGKDTPVASAGTSTDISADISTDISPAPLVLRPRKNALLAPGNHIRDFTIEFWLYPLEVDNGGQVLLVSSSKGDGQGGYFSQRIRCSVIKNRLQWDFINFFFSPDEKKSLPVTLSGPVLLPRTWSHHLIRFDADIGLLEYLVNGNVESLGYTTVTGRESSGSSGEVYTPVIGENCSLAFGSRFAGMMDEFRVYRSYRVSTALAKYSSKGGRVESRALDMGYPDSRLLKIEAFGGRTSNSGFTGSDSSNLLSPGTAGKVKNEYAGNGSLSFPDYSEMRFFVRLSNNPYRWENIPWIPVDPGKDLPDTIRGRFVQVAVDFYPSGDCETSPYLSQLNLVYKAADPPLPPPQLMAVAKDGAVELSWKTSPSRDIGGYLVYYGTSKGEYFGEQAIASYGTAETAAGMLTGEQSPNSMESPIDAGNRTSVRIEGLRNGTLYYFAVAAYNKPYAYINPAAMELPFSLAGLDTRMNLPEPGEFSRETAARPLRMAE
ncbi:MAG: hypothetical protein FWF26_03245 [Treponema sp.]|nr:hypothetical protein [Treponema sp.]